MPHPAPLTRARRRPLAALVVSALALGTLTGLAPVVAPAASAVPVPSCASAGLPVTSLGGPNFYIDGGSTPDFTSGYTGYRVTNAGGSALPDVWVGLGDFTGGALGLASGQAAVQRLGDLAAGGSDSLFWYLTATGQSATAQQHVVTVYDHDPSLSTSVPLCTTTGGFGSVAGTIAASANKVTAVTVGGAAPKLGAQFTVTVTGDTGTIGSGIAGDSESLWMSPAVASAWPASAFRLVSTSLSMSPDGTAAPQTYADTLRLAGLGSKARGYTATYTFQAVGFTAGPTPVQPVQEIASGTQVKHTGTYPASIPPIQAPVNDLVLTATTSVPRLATGGGRVEDVVTVTGQPGATLDSFTVTPPAGSTVVPGTTTWGGAAAAEPVRRGSVLVVPGPFTVPPSGAVTLRLTLDLDGTPGPRTSTVLGVVGSSSIGTAASPVDGSNPASATVVVNRAPAVEAVEAWTDVDTAAVVHLAPHASDADHDALTFAVGPPAAQHGTVTRDGSDLTYTPDEGWTGDDVVTWTAADAFGGSATSTVTVHVAPRAPQVIEFPAPGPMTTPGLTLAGAADSGLPVTWTSLTPAVCTVDASGVVTAVSAGECSVRAEQAGDATHDPAAPVVRTFTVEPTAVVPTPSTPEPQVITFTAPPTSVVAGHDLQLEATTDSGLPLTWTSLTPSVCTVDASGLLVAVTSGTCEVQADQAGDEDWQPATPVTRSITVTTGTTEGDPDPGPTPDAQTISFTAPAQLLSGSAPLALVPTATSGLPVSLEVVSGSCTLDGSALTATDDTVCTVRATQPGSASYAVALPVERTITFVSPAGDATSMDSAASGPASTSIDVLDNDPTGLTLLDAEPGTHGATSVVDGRVAYAPATTFRGTDTFTYRVQDSAGRTATAAVTVVVRNAAPAVDDATVAQLSGSRLRVPLAVGDPNGDDVTLAATTPTDHVGATVEGHELVLSPDEDVSGWVTTTVTADDGADGTTTATVRDLVTPQPVASASRTLTTTGTLVRWAPSPAVGARYEVRADGQPVCVTSARSCSTPRVLGPLVRVGVRVLGRDGTVSTPRPAQVSGRHQVLVATVYFRSGDWHLARSQRARLADVIDRIHAMGFGRAYVSGYTDSDGGSAYNLRLSQRRTRTVSGVLRQSGGIGSRQAWFGYDRPIADNSTAAGKSRNRRVEILVGYDG